MASPRIACFATQGTGSLDEARIVSLLGDLKPEVLRFEHAAKIRSASEVARQLRLHRPDLVVMEGTGLAGGSALMAARRAWGIRFVVSSGDAVGPFWGLRSAALRTPGTLYERALMAMSSGFIGWSPYLVGRALTLGAPRAMTAANWATPVIPTDRAAARERLAIPSDAIVFGLVGSLGWNSKVGYAYGVELVRAIRRVDRPDIRVLIVGDGEGLHRLRDLAQADRRVILPGRVPRDELGGYLAAMDVASLPQSIDQVGSFRYTTKLSEYLTAGLPVMTGRLPLAYDLDDGWLWRLAGRAPWDETYVSGVASLMSEIGFDEVAVRREQVPAQLTLFDRARQQRLVASFLAEIIDDARTQNLSAPTRLSPPSPR